MNHISLSEYRNILAAGTKTAPKKKRNTEEEDLQRACIEWASLNCARLPLLSWLVHIPNGGRRPKGEAGKLKALGVKPGVPDLLLPVPSPFGNWNGLALELKSSVGKLSEAQHNWLTKLEKAGWRCGVIRSLDKFIEEVNLYCRNPLD